MILHLTVTQDHIDRGERSDCASCPVALAFWEAFPGATHVVVMPWGVALYQDQRVLAYGFFPRTVTDWIVDYDAHVTVQPFECDVDIEVQVPS